MIKWILKLMCLIKIVRKWKKYGPSASKKYDDAARLKWEFLKNETVEFIIIYKNIQEWIIVKIQLQKQYLPSMIIS